MQHTMTKRILGGIAWKCAMLFTVLLTHSASSQEGYGYANPSSTGLNSRPILTFQPGLSSKEYLRLMAEANASEISATSHVGSEAQLESTSISTASAATPIAIPTVASNETVTTSVHRFMNNEMEDKRGLQSNQNRVSLQSDPAAKPWIQSPYPNSHAGTFSPFLSVAYENVWMRRAGDEGIPWSTSGVLGAWGEDRATLVRLSYYRNPMERYEVAFLGSLVWHRNATSTQPANNSFSPSDPESVGLEGFQNLENFQNSMQHQHSHTARFRSYEWNKRWITDDLGNYFFGLNVIDYEENYGLQSTDSDGSGWLGMSTSNLLAGMHGGLEIWHPLSQRFAVGGQSILGLYGNFAEGAFSVDVPDQDRFLREDEKFQIAGGFGLNAKARYQFNSRLYAFGSYRWWYLAGMAEVGDQTIGSLVAQTPFSLSTDAGFLLHGATCGLEFVY